MKFLSSVAFDSLYVSSSETRQGHVLRELNSFIILPVLQTLNSAQLSILTGGNLAKFLYHYLVLVLAPIILYCILLVSICCGSGGFVSLLFYFQGD